MGLVALIGGLAVLAGLCAYLIEYDQGSRRLPRPRARGRAAATGAVAFSFFALLGLALALVLFR